jgi:hypothetical protein
VGDRQAQARAQELTHCHRPRAHPMPKTEGGSTQQAGFRVGYSSTYQRSVRIERSLTRNFMQTVTSGGSRRLFRNAAIIYDGLASMPFGALAIAPFSSFHNW